MSEVTEDLAGRALRPVYLLTVDAPDPRAIVLRVRTGEAGIARGEIVTPAWQELPAAWDGPHDMPVALPLADSYAETLGYHAIAIDIESSQLWDPSWGNLGRDIL